MLLAINLLWLPGAIRDIREAQSELQRVAVRGVRDQIHLFLQDKEDAIKSQAKLFRPLLLTQDKEGLRTLTTASSSASRPLSRSASSMRRGRSV
jgi:hypothetical protein